MINQAMLVLAGAGLWQAFLSFTLMSEGIGLAIASLLCLLVAWERKRG